MEGLPGTSFVMIMPIMDIERFCDLSGVEVGVVRGWIEKGYVPTVKVGKRRLINVAVLTREALEAME